MTEHEKTARTLAYEAVRSAARSWSDEHVRSAFVKEYGFAAAAGAAVGIGSSAFDALFDEMEERGLK